MRWNNLTVEAEAATRLPGYAAGAVVRTFDAPEALETRFYEVQAKSALNKVPESSQVPFRWTVNPYRGCSHACTYCISGDAPVLMADGRTKAMEDLVVGDAIIGTRVEGRYRRYVASEVLDHWSSVKPAYRTTLEDGTELVTSGDHRFLTERGWKHVIGAAACAEQRPHLTQNNALMGTGAFAAPPVVDEGYRRGYLCGLIRGDGTIGSREHERPRGGRWTQHEFRLALCDQEALDRATAFLSGFAIGVGELQFSAGGGGYRPARAIRTQQRSCVQAVRDLIRWPLDADDSWIKGFLAGIFDAEGSCGREALRISNADDEILDWTVHAMGRLGLHVVVEDGGRESRVRTVRLRGGLPAQLRFFHLTDPAIRRKCWLDGRALKSSSRLGVRAIEPLGVAMRLYDITTGTGDFIANGVVSHNCFARPTHKYLDFGPGRDFEKEIVVKVNVPEVLRAELGRPSWKGEHVALGTNTDPYQWVEGRYKLMPAIWEAMRDARNPCSVLTKSPLLLRDLPLMLEIAAVAEFSANLSVPTIDEKAWRASEPHTPNPRARLEAVGELNRAGIPCGVLVAPLMPGINDDPRQVEEILQLAADNGATGVTGIALHLRGDVRRVFMDWLRSYRPDLVAHYERLYARGGYLPQAERQRLGGMIRGGPLTTRPSPWRDHRGIRRMEGKREEIVAVRPPAPVQEALF
ncbi:MAG: Radical domain protein [Solirubrobacterales bacterium]|nr:Radical domain protein [Solirubrobacterales bacterium]